MKKTVLLVEDNDTYQKTLSRALERLGYQVIVAEHGQRALEILNGPVKPEEITAVLIDFQMPVMNGEQLTQTIRADARLKSLPLVATSGTLQGPDSCTQLFLDGCDSICCKKESSKFRAHIKGAIDGAIANQAEKAKTEPAKGNIKPYRSNDERNWAERFVKKIALSPSYETTAMRIS